MIRVNFILYIDSIPENETKELLDFKVFEKAKSRFDKEINDYVYHKVLELDAKYNFVEWETCPYVEIEYLDDKSEIIYRDNCIDYIFNL